MIEENRILEILKEHIDAFINNITFELEEKHADWFEGFGFPVFGVISNNYHEQVYFQSYLESYARKMINGILYDVLYEECIDDQFKWPEFEYVGIYNGYTNSEKEKKFGFELIDLIDHIGYRYTFAHLDEVDGLLEKGNVEKIKIVNWISDDDVVGYIYDDERIDAITSRDFFKELLFDWPPEMVENFYDKFITSVHMAIDKAKNLISLETVPGFTPSYLHQLRKDIILKLNKEKSFPSSFYVKNKKYKSIQNDSKQLIEQYNILKYFLEMKFQYSLIGKGSYAKSFLTSEYLYRYFEKNLMFDYTPIVSGYIKSIEQLLHLICESYNKANGRKDNLNGYTLGSYTKYIDQHEMILRQEVRDAKDIIVSCLDSYRIESRNHLFHRDYFNKWNRVNNIRNNTIFLYVVLLGAINSELIENDKRILDLLDNKYDKVFEILSGLCGVYGIEFKDCAYDEVEIQRRDKGKTYDTNGQIITPIICVIRDTYNETTTEIEISRNNIPIAVWSSNNNGDKHMIWEDRDK